VVAPELPPRLDADDFYAALGGPANYDVRLEQDYVLSRIAWLNCGAWDPKRPTPLILKGGFAIRHTYASERLSADVDLVPDGASARGIDAPLLPPEARLTASTAGPSGRSMRHTLTFPLVVGARAGKVWIDRSTGDRSLRLPPPQVRTFTSRFMDDFPVWVACIEEIVGEKSGGLLAFTYGDVDRIKDAFDLWFLLTNGHAARLNERRLRQVLEQLRLGKDRVQCPTQGLGVYFRSTLEHRDAELWWRRSVQPLLRGRARVSFETVREQLPDLAQRLLV
jgi:hypothetical protein